MACPDLSQLERLAGGDLDADAGVALRSHVSTCDACRVRMAEIADLAELARRVARAGSSGDEPHPPSTVTGVGLECADMTPGELPGYELLEEIGRGGQGVVYRALQRSTRRRVAIKVLRGGAFAEEREKARFEREVLVLSQFQHPNIVAIHDSGVVGGHPYFVIDYISGVPLDVYVRDRTAAGGSRDPGSTDRLRPPFEALLTLFVTICDAIHAAHVRGIIHRDIKPSNIKVDNEGRPHILDFGLAKLLGADGAAPVETISGQFLGSVPWSSPEQAEGGASRLDTRSDVYSLGVMLYQLLTGQFPYDVSGGMREVLDRIARDPPRPPREHDARIDEDLEAIVLKCLRKPREARYQTAGDLAADLRRLQAGEPVEARRGSTAYMISSLVKRYRLHAAIAGAFAVVLLAATVVSVLLAIRANHDRRLALAGAAELRDSSMVLERLLQNKGDLAAAVPMFADILDQARSQYGEVHPATARAACQFGWALRAAGQLDKARDAMLEAARTQRRLMGDSDPRLAQTLMALATVESESGLHESALTRLREASTIMDGQRVEPEHAIRAKIALAEELTALRRFAESQSTLDAARDRLKGDLRSRPGPMGPALAAAYITLYQRWNEAEPGKGHDREAERWATPPRDASRPAR